MVCLRSGHCCRSIPPPSVPVDAQGACVHLREEGGVASCAIYEDRPAECAAHDFPASVCPIGADVLGIRDGVDLERRLVRIGELP